MQIKKENRSLSPHLNTYKPQITSIISIFHRISGSVLAIILLCTPMCVDLFNFILSFNIGLTIYNNLLGIFTTIALNVFLATFIFHLINGLRHLLWDLGVGLNLNDILITASLVLLITLSITLLITLL
uniref:succinate dehydrogenase subunit 3 n=1 Tax=Cryptomonas gyropyrenoidosa TaxID=233257 RepID=UPI00279DA71C|nr:succinate dehydrogenase subunit 3 [Cryptomonas gyropyrenoidosa]WFQ82709.1 succinate dehydrogenase subunit 3 [Cryptomonas gyropyrenoidosa]